MKRDWKMWTTVIAVAVAVAAVFYASTINRAEAQMGGATAPPTDPMVRIAAALERIASAMEQSRTAVPAMSGMMGMGKSMRSDMMQNCRQMMQMMEMMQGMMGQGSQMPMQPQQPVPAGQINEEALTRTTTGAGITVAVTFMNPIMKAEETAGKLVFKLALDTHSGDLLALDLTKLASLRTSEGIVVSEGFTWEPISESGHHRSGYLKLDAAASGVPLITTETKYIELELKQIGTPSRLFRWEGALVAPQS